MNIRVLIVCSSNSGRIAPFILEQGDSLMRAGAELEYFAIEGKGLVGYLNNRSPLIKCIATFSPTVIHAHYGLSGLLANLQRSVRVVTTYHGSDINNATVFPFSKLSILLSAHNIFVSAKNLKKATSNFSLLPKRLCKVATESTMNVDVKKPKYPLIPCGVDIHLFTPMDKGEARKALMLDSTKKLILFSGDFSNKVKNSALAMKAVSVLNDVDLLELKGYTREQVALLMNAADCVLMTSFTEGSPQCIKEAMACNCPVVSVPVGDVPEIVNGIAGCYITSYDPSDVVSTLKQACAVGKRTDGRQRIIEKELDIDSVAKRILRVYDSVLSPSL